MPFPRVASSVYRCSSYNRIPAVSMLRHPPTSSFSSSSKLRAVLFDQTKKNNDPNDEKRDAHVEATRSAEEADSTKSGSPPQDTAKEPTSSTGIKTEGGGSSPGHDGNKQNIAKEKFPEQ